MINPDEQFMERLEETIFDALWDIYRATNNHKRVNGRSEEMIREQSRYVFGYIKMFLFDYQTIKRK